MPGSEIGPEPLPFEDSITRIASPAATDNRGIASRYDRRTLVLVDGPNAGETVEYWMPVVEFDGTVSGTFTPGDNKVEDTAHSSSDVGSFSLAVRNDTEGTMVNANGDYAPFQVDASGRLRVVLPAGVSGLTDSELRATPVPVSGPVTDTQLRATPVPVSGTVTATGPLTDTQLRATPVPVSGTVTVTDGSGPLTVDGTVAVSGTVPVSGPLTDTQIRATPLPVSGTVTVTDGSGPLTVDGTVAVSGPVAVTGPLTDAELRASSVPVSVSGEVEVKNDSGSSLSTKDDFTGGEILADVTGSGAVSTFTFSSAVHLVVALATGTGATIRVDPFGGTPTSTQGIRCDEGVPTFIPVITSSVKAFIPAGVVATVFGYRR